jgi:hypothetical protein
MHISTNGLSMVRLHSLARLSVTVLTLSVTLSGCAIIGRSVGETCNTQAYVRTDIESFISGRFTTNTPVRVAIIPFEVPGNLSGQDLHRPGLGYELAWGVQRQLLQSEVLPVVEVFNRADWPRKKEEFFTGNFGALERARNAGYDLVMVGYMDPQKRLDTWTVHTKLIEVESGISLWYGTSTVYTVRTDLWEVPATLYLMDRRPDFFYYPELLGEISWCIAHDMLNDPEYS